MFSSNSFTILSLAFKYFIHLKLIFVFGRRYRFNFILLHSDIQFSQQKFLKRLFPPLNCLGTYFENQLAINVQNYFYSKFYSIVLYIYSHASILQSLLIQLCIFLKWENVRHSTMFIFLKIVLYIFGPRFSLIHFTINLTFYFKEINQSLIRIVLNLQINFN